MKIPDAPDLTLEQSKQLFYAMREKYRQLLALHDSGPIGEFGAVRLDSFTEVEHQMRLLYGEIRILLRCPTAKQAIVAMSKEIVGDHANE